MLLDFERLTIFVEVISCDLKLDIYINNLIKTQIALTRIIRSTIYNFRKAIKILKNVA